MKREDIRWMSKKVECVSGQHGFMTVGLGEIKPAIYLLLIGYALSTLICIFEYLFQRTYTCVKVKQNRRIKNKHAVRFFKVKAYENTSK